MILKLKPEKILPVFENFAQFIDEATIIVDENGLKSVCADRAMVCIFSLEIPKTDFELFELDRKKTNVQLDILNFTEILKRAKDELITLDIGKKNMKIGFDTIRKFTIPYLDLTEEELPEISELKFTSSFRIPVDILETAIKDGVIIGEHLDIKTEEEEVIFLTRSDVSEVETEVFKDKLSVLNGKANARYPLDYLKKLKFENIDEVEILFGKDYPLKIVFGNCFMVLAPRVGYDE